MNILRLIIVLGLDFALLGASGCSSEVNVPSSSGDSTSGSTTSSTTSSSSSSGNGGAGGGGAEGSGGAGGGVPACSGPPTFATTGIEFILKAAAPCATQKISVYGDQIACAGITVNIEGLEAPIVSYIPDYPNAGNAGITVSMPPQLKDKLPFTPGDQSTASTKIVVINPHGAQTSTSDVVFINTDCTAGP